MESLNEIDNAVQQKNMNRFLIGILIFSISINFFSDFLSNKVMFILLVTGVAMASYNWVKLASWVNVSNWYLRISISLLILWELYIVCHGFIFQLPFIWDHLFTDNRAMSYLLPFAVFLPVTNAVFLQKTFDFAYKLGVAFLLFLPFLLLYILDNQDFAEQYVWMLGCSCGFILLTFFYHSKKRVIVSFIVMFLSLFIITIMARRNIMITCACFLFVSLLIIPLFNKNITIVKKGLFIFSFVTVVYLGFNFFVSNETGMFQKITKRATSDTREEVFILYFLDMSDKDWIVGKGLNGTYFCPGIDKQWSGGEDPAHRDLDDRVYIENGFLQLILNGGIIYLVLYMLVLVPAIILGLFLSRNLLSKGCAILILLFILDMIPFGLPTFSFRHFIVWFCVAICFSKQMRLKNDEEISELLQPVEPEIKS